MDSNNPKTRNEKKKNQREKGAGVNGKYSTKHIRRIEKQTEILNDKKYMKPINNQ